jgi:hypothetical protein
MAVAKKCDMCGKYYEDLKENHFIYEEGGQDFLVNSFRLGNWNPRTKSWESIVSAYDICKDCGQAITQAIFNVGENLVTRKKERFVKKDHQEEVKKENESN